MTFPSFRKHILEMTPYKPPLEGRSAEDYLLLDFNERTSPVSPRVKQALLDFINSDRLQVYPEYGEFLAKLASYVGASESELMITNGSDQGIEVIYKAITGPSTEAIVPVPTFPMLFHSAEVMGLKVHSPSYTESFQYPLEEVFSLINDRTRAIVVCNPNSPTGTLLDKAKVLQIAEAAPHAAILVDECYFEYSSLSVKEHISKYPNLFITRTLSKTWGLASLRIGYIITCSSNIEQLLKVRGPYDVNKLSVVAASAALDDRAYMEQYVNEVNDTSKPMFLSFLESNGIRFWPTSSNFVLIYPPDAGVLTEELRKRGILVRPRSGPNIEGTVRITLGTEENTERLISAMKELL